MSSAGRRYAPDRQALEQDTSISSSVRWRSAVNQAMGKATTKGPVVQVA